jgi:hypothetical protein
MTERFAIYGPVVAIFAASEILARALGIRFVWGTLGTLYQSARGARRGTLGSSAS